MQTLISGQFNAFENGFNTAGVYMASGLIPSSQFEKPIYIGGSVNLRNRICYDHILQLRNRKHHNPPFENYVYKHGVNQIVWFLLEACEKENVLLREQYYLNLYRPFCDEKKGFNVSKDVAAPTKGRKHSIETRTKMAQTKLGKPGNKHTAQSKALLAIAATGRKWSIEQKTKQSELLKGKKRSLQACAKMSEARRRRIPTRKYTDFALLSPLGEISRFNSVQTCAKECNLLASEVYKLLQGIVRTHRGWALSTEKLVKD